MDRHRAVTERSNERQLDRGAEKAMAKSPVHEFEQISVRVNSQIVIDADDLIDFVSIDQGRPARRADVLRIALMKGIVELQRSRAKRKR
jgi:hypothetical protein